RVDGEGVRLTDDLRLDRRIKHDIEIVVDRLKCDPASRPRLAEAVEQALALGEGNLIVAVEGESEAGRGREPPGEGAPQETPARMARTSSSRPTTPARTATGATSRPARSCSASTARTGCAPTATGWGRATASTPTC